MTTPKTIEEVTPERNPLNKLERFDVRLGGGLVPVRIHEETYARGGKAVSLVVDRRCKLGGETLEPGEEVCRLSVWFPETERLPAGCWFLKDYSENQAIVTQLVQKGILTTTGHEMAESGFVRMCVARLAWQCECGADVSGQAETGGYTHCAACWAKR